MLEHSRRGFLKASSLAALGTTLVDAAGQEQPGKRAETVQTPASAPVSNGLAGLVNLFQGTDSNYYFSRGNALPIAAMPFGMAHWTLQSRSGSPWMFQPADRRIQGLRCTHQLSPWLSDYGHAVFLPFSGDPQPDPDARSSSYRPEEAQLLPYALRLKLLRYQADVELVATERCCVITATFADAALCGLMVEIPGKNGTVEPDASRRALRFESRANAGGVPDNFATYYVVQFAEPWQNFEVREAGGNRVGVIRFQAGTNRPVEARIATSFISFEQASRNLQLEVGDRAPAELRAQGEQNWNTLLGRIRIEGATEAQRRTFYSCL